MWEVQDADIIIFCDMSLSSMGFWYPNLNSGFFLAALLDWLLSGTPRTEWIPLFEFICVVSALQHASYHATPDSKITIFTDSQNTVNIFGSLCATLCYNILLQHAVDIMIDRNLHVRVLHVASEHNIVANHLSCSLSGQAITCVGHHLCPLSINLFLPPLV